MSRPRPPGRSRSRAIPRERRAALVGNGGRRRQHVRPFGGAGALRVELLLLAALDLAGARGGIRGQGLRGQPWRESQGGGEPKAQPQAGGTVRGGPLGTPPASRRTMMVAARGLDIADENLTGWHATNSRGPNLPAHPKHFLVNAPIINSEKAQNRGNASRDNEIRRVRGRTWPLPAAVRVATGRHGKIRQHAAGSLWPIRLPTPARRRIPAAWRP